MTYTFYMPGPPEVVEEKKEVKTMVHPEPPHIPLADQYIEPVPSISGWMDGSELQWIYSRAREMSSVVEIGCWMGKSTHALLSACIGTVYAVDNFKGSPGERDGGAHAAATRSDIGKEFFRNVGHFPNLYLMEMDSILAASYFDDLSVDMVWIDGGHDFQSIWDDLTAWWPKCRRLFCGHDASQDGVPEALKKFESIAGPHKRAGNIWYIDVLEIPLPNTY